VAEQNFGARPRLLILILALQRSHRAVLGRRREGGRMGGATVFVEFIVIDVIIDDWRRAQSLF
jgi:hypothetical protein